MYPKITEVRAQKKLIWMGNPKFKKNPKIQNPNPEKIQKSMKSKIWTQIQNSIFFWIFKLKIQLK